MPESIIIICFILIGILDIINQSEGRKPSWFDYWMMYFLYGLHVVADYLIPWLLNK